jgi:beta-N-acetylhexosaminidase
MQERMSNRALPLALAACFLVPVLVTGCSKDKAAPSPAAPPPMATASMSAVTPAPSASSVVRATASPVKSGTPAAPTNGSSSTALQDRLKTMTPEEKLGQLLIAGLDGTEAGEEARRLVADTHVGGFILYKPNMTDAGQTVTLLNRLKEFNRPSGIPLLLSVDQEGGKVSRLPVDIELPANRDLAAGGTPDRARALGKAVGQELKAFGFNLNYAPVLDINSNPANPVIGPRSYGSDANIVKLYGLAAMQGLRDGGVIPVVKHFPGHGDTSTDSHLELPVVNKSLAELEKLELQPFRAAAEAGADAIMAAHILLPRLDPDYPATLSPAIITGLLREKIGYSGVVITDDMTMGAIAKHYPLKDAAVRAVLAGCDLVLVAHGYSQVQEAAQGLKDALADGRLTWARVDESVARVLALKASRQLADTPVAASPDIGALRAAVKQALAVQ